MKVLWHNVLSVLAGALIAGRQPNFAASLRFVT